MKKVLSVLLIFCLFASFSIAEETTETDWYYPFGLSDDSTFDEVVDKLLTMYPTDEKLVKRKEDSTVFRPANSMLFDTPISGIIVKRFGDNGFAYIMIQLSDKYDDYGIIHFLDVLDFLLANCKTNLLNIEPSTTTYDLNGEPIVKTFLNDLNAFQLDYLDREKVMDCTVSWHEALANLKKDSESYSISLLFYSRVYMQ